MSQSREELIEYLDTHCIDSYGELQTCQVADFILADRKRVVSPLVLAMKGSISDNGTYEAIEQTLKNAGVE